MSLSSDSRVEVLNNVATDKTVVKLDNEFTISLWDLGQNAMA